MFWNSESRIKYQDHRSILELNVLPGELGSVPGHGPGVAFYEPRSTWGKHTCCQVKESVTEVCWLQGSPQKVAELNIPFGPGHFH